MVQKVFLFPLSKISLQLATSKPLNIFEPRYLKMVKDSIAQNIPIALGFSVPSIEGEEAEGWLDVGASFVRENICMGIPEVIQECSDGAMVIMLPGKQRGKITKALKSDSPYLVCEYEEVNSHNELKPENILLLRRLKTQLEKWVAKYVKLDCQKDVLTPCLTQPVEVIGLYTEFMVDNPLVKQKVLEMDDINDKIHYLIFNYS